MTGPAMAAAPRPTGETHRCVAARTAREGAGASPPDLADDGERARADGRARGATRRRAETRKRDVRIANIESAKGVSDAIRTSLGPRGMDK